MRIVTSDGYINTKRNCCIKFRNTDELLITDLMFDGLSLSYIDNIIINALIKQQSS